MRILTVRQPWAWAIFNGKDVENRSTNVAGNYRGPVAIHAAQKGSEDEACVAVWSMWLDTPDPDLRGSIVGVVDLVDVHHAYGEPGSCWTAMAPADGGDPVEEFCSTWAQDDNFHLVLANPRPLAVPIPYKGALGLRGLDDDTTARILAQIGDPS